MSGAWPDAQAAARATARWRWPRRQTARWPQGAGSAEQCFQASNGGATLAPQTPRRCGLCGPAPPKHCRGGQTPARTAARPHWPPTEETPTPGAAPGRPEWAPASPRRQQKEHARGHLGAPTQQQARLARATAERRESSVS